MWLALHYYVTRKSNPFHGFLNGLTVSTLGSMPLTFHLGRILQLFCSITWISVFMLRKRWNLPLNLPYLRTHVPIFWLSLMILSTWGPPSSGHLNLVTLRHRPYNTIWGPTDPFPFSGPQPLGPSSKTLSWDSLGMSCKKVRRYCALITEVGSIKSMDA